MIYVPCHGDVRDGFASRFHRRAEALVGAFADRFRGITLASSGLGRRLDARAIIVLALTGLVSFYKLR